MPKDARHEHGSQQLTQMLGEFAGAATAQESEVAPDPASFTMPQRRMLQSCARPFRHLLYTVRRAPGLRLFAARVFRTCQRLGLNVTPRHFYFPIPDLDSLSEKDWTAYVLPDAVSLSLDNQLRMLESGLRPFLAERVFP